MPTLDELGHRIADPFRRTPSFQLLPAGAMAALLDGRMPGGNLEAWLTNLASPAPYLDQSERLALPGIDERRRDGDEPTDSGAMHRVETGACAVGEQRGCSKHR